MFMTTTPNKLTRLAAGETLQAGDFIQREVAYTNDKNQGPSWEHKDTKLHPIQSHTIGRVILESDLINARYFRP